MPVPRRTAPARLAASLGLALAASAVAAQDGPLQVPSPDWRDQVVYFLMIDRFDDGDAGNNDQGAGEYDPADGRKYSGGDLAGVARRLDYLRDLGATAVWITPPVANQWWNPGGSYGGYHGYWASDFSAVDAHYGTLDDYRALSRALHGRGMYLVQDVVVNHVADWIRCDDGVDPADAASIAAHCMVRTDAQGRSAPVQAPFDRNDPDDPADRAAGLYHFTPSISDFEDRRQELEFALAGLDDLDTENPEVRRALRDAYGMWIREVGVDAFRVDTAFHVPADFFPDFLQAPDAGAPGVARVAADTGRADFLSFGEGFGADRAFDDRQARKLDAYMRVDGGLPSMINFPLYGTLGDVFARGRPTAELRHRIDSMMAVHADPWRMPTFVDNHDVDRFLAGGSEAALKQALLAMLSLPGIPVIWQGTEQGFTERRRAMFAGGHQSGGRDHFDPDAPLYRYLRRAIALRRDHPVLSRGTPTVLAANAARAGAIAWRMDHAGEAMLVVFNAADGEVLLDGLAAGLPAGTGLSPAFAIEGEAPVPRVARDGTLTLRLPARSGYAWTVVDAEAARGAAAPASPMADAPAIDPLPAATLTGAIVLRGDAPGGRPLHLVVDGDLSRATPVEVAPDGRWRATLRTDAMVDPAIVHRVVAFDPATGTTSPARTFRVALDWAPAADVADPIGDDTGPSGSYTYPTDPGWRDVHPADIERVRAWTAGGALRFEVTLRAIGSAWNPANGFDHVAVTAFLEIPGQGGGIDAMPQQHATLPDGMRWHRRLRAHGWSNSLFASDGADADSEGTPVAPAPGLAVDAHARTLTFTLPADALGDPATLDGARLHVATWDYDEGFRRLAPEAGANTFGGGPADGPRVMDAATLTLGGR